MSHPVRIALAGNPNSGKTSVFNAVTGAHQRVGNYPGVTVERKVGWRRHGDIELELVDLPGAYSLSAYSGEESIARDDLVDNPPDVVVCVVDASNLERNLYLAVQLLEVGLPVVIALNMVDVARSRGIDVDADALAARMSLPVVPTIGHRGRGVRELIDAAVTAANQHGANDAPPIPYGRGLDDGVEKLMTVLTDHNGDIAPPRRRWVALKLLERDPVVTERYARGQIAAQAERIIRTIEAIQSETPALAFAAARYNFISRVCSRVTQITNVRRRTKTERIDALVTHRVLGLPIFLALMFGVFQLTFALGDPMMNWIDAAFAWLGNGISSWWPHDPSSPLRSLLVDGIIGGAGSVLIFLPDILLLFLAISLLEGSGYMARAAFIMDRLMQRIGLHGKSFIPMLIGFGCSVPAIMATRTLDNRRDRLATMLVIPLISCSARLPIYLLIIPAFFPHAWQAPMLWFIYIIGIALAIVSARLLSVTVLRTTTSTFLMELPPYKMPTLRHALIEMWGRGSVFLRKVGTLILGATIVMWALTSFPRPDDGRGALRAAGAVRPASSARQIEYSAAGRVGRAMEPVIRPMGFDWKIGTALIGAIAAKEVFVAQLGVIYSIDGADDSSEGLRAHLRHDYGPLVAFCIMLFALISSPCMSTVAVMRRESNSWRWAMFQYGGLTFIAYLITMIVFQVGTRLIPLIAGV